MQRWKVVELAADPPGWQAEISGWAEQWGAVVVEYQTNRRSQMAPACSRFWSAVVEATLSHEGDPRLAQHLANTVVKESPEGLLIVKTRPDSPRKIDLAVAAVIAYDRAIWHFNDVPSVGWRGL